jgi:hypothetical protein
VEISISLERIKGDKCESTGVRNGGHSMDKMALPYGVSLSGLLDVLIAWNRARGYESACTTKEVAAWISSDAKPESKAKVVSNQSSFLTQIGILKKEGKQSRLTEIGYKTVRMIDYRQDEKFNEILRGLLLKWTEGHPLLEYLFYIEQETKENMIRRVVEDSGKSMKTTNAVMGATTLIELLEQVQIVSISPDGIVSFNQQIDLDHEVAAEIASGESREIPIALLSAKKSVGTQDEGVTIHVSFTIAGSLDEVQRERILADIQTVLKSLSFKVEANE